MGSVRGPDGFGSQNSASSGGLLHGFGGLSDAAVIFEARLAVNELPTWFAKEIEALSANLK